MKITKKLNSLVLTTAVLFCFVSCSSLLASNSENPSAEVADNSSGTDVATGEITVEMERALQDVESLSLAAGAVVKNGESGSQSKIVENPAMDPSLIGTWQYGYYSDVINFSNDACYGRVNLRALTSKVTLSEGGIYSASNGKITVFAYDVKSGEKNPVKIVESTHTYKIISKNCIEFDGAKYYRVR